MEQNEDLSPVHSVHNASFLAMMYYIRIVDLLAKLDYWTTNPYHSYHKIVHNLGMTQDCFQFLWCHFHVKDLEEVEHENEYKDDEEELYKVRIEKTQRDQDKMDDLE